MEESFTLIQEKWNLGVYGLIDMMNLVKKEKISKEEFFDITRYNYDGILKTKKYKINTNHH